MTTKQIPMFPDGSDLLLFSGVPQIVRVKPFQPEETAARQLRFAQCPLCLDTGTIKIHHRGSPGGMVEIPCVDARHGAKMPPLVERIADHIVAPVQMPESEPEPGTAYVIERADASPKEHAIKPRRSHAKIEPELKAARERAAQYFVPVITTRLIAERDLLSLEQIRSPGDAAGILAPYYEGLDKEHMLVMLLNTKNHVLGVHVAFVGSVHTTVVRIGELFRPAVLMNAAGIIVSHNHPSGDPTPSPEDVAITRAIVKASDILDIDALDHLIIGANGRFVSLKERGLGY